jgi:hypothetical protein
MSEDAPITSRAGTGDVSVSSVPRSPLIAVAQWMQRVAEEHVETGLSSVHVALLIAVAQYQGFNQHSRAGQTTLAAAAHCARSTAIDALEDLVEHGWVVATPQPNGFVMRYSVTLENGRAIAGRRSSLVRRDRTCPGAGQAVAPVRKPDTTCPEAGHHLSGSRTPTCPEAGHEKTTEEIKEKTTEETRGAATSASLLAPKGRSKSKASGEPRAQDTYVHAFRRGLDASRERVQAVSAVALTAPKLGTALGAAVGAVAQRWGTDISGESVPRFIEASTILFVRYQASLVAKKGPSYLGPRYFGIFLNSLSRGDIEAILAGRHTGAEHVLTVFAQEHERILGGKYVESDDDFAAAGRIVNNARQAAKDANEPLKPWVEHWVRRYLADEKAKGRSPALKFMAERPVNLFGKPGEAINPAAANTGARGPSPRFAAPMQRGGAHIEAEWRAKSESIVLDETGGF